MPRDHGRRPAGARRTARTLGTLALALAFACPAKIDAQPDSPVALEAALREALAFLAAAAPNSAERAAAVARAVSLREQLAEALPGDDRACTWLTDAAVELLSPLERNGTQASVLLGIPTAEQRIRARETAARATALLERAERAGAAAVDRLEASLFTPGAPAGAADPATEAALSRLVDGELTQRIPYYTALASAILGSTSDDPAERGEMARRAVVAIADRSMGSPGAEAARRVLLGAIFLNDPRGSAASRTTARDHFAPIASDASAPPAVRLAAEMGVLVAEPGDAARSAARVEDRFRADEAAGVLPAWGRALLIAEAAARGLRDSGASRSGNVPGRLEEAMTPLLRLAAVSRPRPIGAAARLAVYEKISAAVDRTWPLEQMDAEISLARGITLARSGATPDERAEALSLLENVARREGAGDLRAEALWEVASITGVSESVEDNIRAMEALVDLAYSFPSHERADRCVAAGARLGRFVLGREGGAPLDAALASRARAAYRQALRMAVADPALAAEADDWRIELARISLDEGAGTDPTGELGIDEFDGVVSLLNTVKDPARLDPAGEGVFRRAVELVLEPIRTARRSAVLRGDDAAAAAALAGLVHVQRAVVAWEQRRSGPRVHAERLALVNLLLDASDPRALESLRELSEGGSAGPGVDPLALRLASGRAGILTGNLPEAFDTLRGVAQQLDRPDVGADPASPRPAMFWTAWADMLDILRRQNADGARTAAIRLHIRNLELIDPALGGPESARRITRVRDSLTK